MERKDGGDFNFSQDLMRGLSQMSQASQRSSQCSSLADCTWSGESQSLIQPTKSMLPVPREIDRIVPLSRTRSSPPDLQKAKYYNLAKRIRGTKRLSKSKTAEDDRRIKRMKRVEEEHQAIKINLEQVQTAIGDIGNQMADVLKESTNALEKTIRDRNDKLKSELLKETKSVQEKQFENMMKMNQEKPFEILTAVADIKQANEARAERKEDKNIIIKNKVCKFYVHLKKKAMNLEVVKI